MRRDDAISRLPEPYAIALRLRDAGVSDDQLAAGLAIDADALPSFLAIAEAKLADLARRPVSRNRKDAQ